MNISAKAQSTVTPPVLLCRLCHCEFTNFKEHVKSLVHLDARETKTTAKPPTKNKGSYEDHTANAKKVKTDIGIEKSSSNTSSEGVEKSDENKNSTSKSKTNLSIDAESLYDPFLEDAETDTITETDAITETANLKDLKKNDDTLKNLNEAPPSVSREYERHEELLSKEVFLEKHWHCKLCDCRQHADDGSFDEHAKDKIHVESLARKPFSLRQTSEKTDHYQWLINCSACALETNDRAQFISHLQTKLHDENIRNILENAGTAGENGALRSHSSESRVSETNTKSFAKETPSTEERNTNSKSASCQADAIRSSSGKLHQGRSHGGSSTPQSVKHNTSKSTPKPLMSLSLPELPESWNKSKPGWNSTSAVSRNPNHTPTNKPGILGEYRPDSHSYIGFDGLDRRRCTDLRSTDCQDSLLHSRSGPGASVGRLSPLDVNHRDTLSATSARADLFTALRGSDRYNPLWSRQTSLASPTDKLHSLSFAQEAERSRQLEILTNLLTSQRTGILPLPSTPSLDLASNSSLRLKHSSERDAMFDNYLASRSGVSRSDFSRNDLAKANSSTSDHYSGPMFSRR